MAIYTKKGDKGETALYDSQNSQRIRIDKDSLRIEAIGSIDELNSYLGVVKGFTENTDLKSLIEQIQSELLTIGSILAGSNLRLSVRSTNRLERLIDEWEGDLPVLKNFVLPGGTKFASHLQYARSLTRRAERRVVALSKSERVSHQILKYLNRLSDFLFMLARKANADVGVGDEVWKR